MANEHSQIVPSMQPTAKVADFKFWCQKVLPLVYDDSLSYYEVLNKMVVYLNQVIDNINADIDNVAELEDDFLLLQEYVNNFFDDIDQLVTYTERAEAAQTAAATSAINAASSASNAATSAVNAASSAGSAATSALNAMDAKDAAVAAKTAAESALANAQTAAINAAASATAAGNSADAASGSAINAAASAASALQNFQLADAARVAAQSAADDAEAAAELIDMDATASDVGKAIIVKTVSGGKVTAYEFGESGGGGGGGTGGIINTIENVPVASFDDGTDAPVVELIIGIEPVQSGSGDPAPDNERPISGWTGVNIWDDPFYGGTIKWNQLAKNGNFATDSNWVASSGTSYAINNGIASVHRDSGVGIQADFGIDDNDSVQGIGSHKYLVFATLQTTNGQVDIIPTGTASEGRTGYASYPNKTRVSAFAEVPAETTRRIRCSIRGYTGGANIESAIDYTVENVTAYDLTAMFGAGKEPTTAAEFVALFPDEYYDYNVSYTETTVGAIRGVENRHLELPFPVEAGTAYGGTLTNLGTGEWKLRVDRAKYIGTWGSSGGSDLGTVTRRAFTLPIRADISDIPNRNGKHLCNIAPYVYRYSDDYLHYYIATETTLYMFLPNNTSADTQFEAVYPIETPVEYTLTTSEIIELLAGYNNVWADTGNINLLKYIANGKQYVDEKDSLVKALIAKELDSMIADTALVANDFRIVNNTLYKITGNIASGGTLTPGTNCVATTIGEVLKTLLT